MSKRKAAMRTRARRAAPAPAADDGTCVTGCGRPVSIKKHRLCHTHYIRYLRTGAAGPAEIRERREVKPYRPTA